MKGVAYWQVARYVVLSRISILPYFLLLVNKQGYQSAKMDRTEEALMSVAQRIIEARTRKELTQRDVAALLGVSQAFYAQMESGLKVPTLAMAKQISNVLGVTMDYLAENDSTGSTVKH